MKKKFSEVELKIKTHISPEINYQNSRTVSYSQFSIYQKCPYQWYLTYVENKQPYQASIHTVFGTAFHETLQQYIEVMYNQTGAAADKLDLENIFTTRFREVYSEEYKKIGTHFSSPKEMGEFFDDGIAILKWIRKNRNKLFTIRKVKLLGIELPLIFKIANNLYYKAYIDFALYDIELDKIYIYDIKTSTRGWSDTDKRDNNKIAQVLLYKQFFSSQFKINIEKIEVEFFIVKRKIWEQSEYPIPRAQSFKPTSGKIKLKQAIDNFQSFVNNCFDEFGKPQIKSYIKQVGESSCKWCPYNNKQDLCNKNASFI